MAGSLFNLENQSKKTKLAQRQKTAMALGRLAEVHKMMLWDRAKEHNLTPIQLQVLLFVAHHSPAQNTVSYLADEFFVSKASMSDTVKALSAKGLVQKKIGIHDKRSYSLTLSGSGNKLCQSLNGVGSEFLAAIQALPEEQQTNLYKGLLGILHALTLQGTIQPERICFSCRHHESTPRGSYCHLLKKELPVAALRVDCPEHIPA